MRNFNKHDDDGFAHIAGTSYLFDYADKPCASHYGKFLAISVLDAHRRICIVHAGPRLSRNYHARPRLPSTFSSSRASFSMACEKIVAALPLAGADFKSDFAGFDILCVISHD